MAGLVFVDVVDEDFGEEIGVDVTIDLECIGLQCERNVFGKELV